MKKTAKNEVVESNLTNGIIFAKCGKEVDAPSVAITDPYAKISLTEAVSKYGEKTVLDYFQASRVIAVQRTLRSVLAKEGEEAAIEAGLAKCESLTPIRRAGTPKSTRKTRADVEAQFTAQGMDVNDLSIKTIIDALFTK